MKRMMKWILGAFFVLFLGTIGANAQTPKAKPRTMKHAAVSGLAVVTAPVVHPKRTVKQTLGALLFVGETGVDVAHLFTSILDNGTATPKNGSGDPSVDKVVAVLHYPFHYANLGVAKVDSTVEGLELLLFGMSN